MGHDTLVLVESADAADYGSTLFTFGINDNGELGLGDTKRRLKPCVMIRPKGMEFMEHWVSLSGGGKHSVALTNQGHLVLGLESLGTDRRWGYSESSPPITSAYKPSVLLSKAFSPGTGRIPPHGSSYK